MKKHIGHSLWVIGALFLITQSAFSQDRDIGFSKRFGGTEEQRDIQLAIMNNTADMAAKVQALSNQMGSIAASIERMSVSLQNAQKGVDRQITETMKTGDTAREQRDILNLMVRYMARQQQLNEQLVEENRQIREALTKE